MKITGSPCLLSVALLLLAAPRLFAQKDSRDYTITLPEQKIAHSLYNSIEMLDSRDDTTFMGIIQVGAMNKKVRLIAKAPLSLQFKSVLNALTGQDAGNGKLLLQLRQFSFAEVTGATSEKGYCYLRAQLFAEVNDVFHLLRTIDTVLLVKSMDVTKAIQRKGSELVTDFIAGSLLQEPAGQLIYSLHDVKHFDSLEKRKIPLYNTNSYSDGLYASYQSFMNLTPDQPAEVSIARNGKLQVKTVINGKPQKVKSQDIYAIVHNGTPYIATNFGYYPLHKINDDFIFTGKAKVTANSTDVIAAGFFFGILGGLIAADASALFEMKIDHLNGGFIHMREIKGGSDNQPL